MPWLTAALTQCLPTARDAWLVGRVLLCWGETMEKGVNLCKDRAKSIWRGRDNLKQFLQWGALRKHQRAGAGFLHQRSGENDVLSCTEFCVKK